MVFADTGKSLFITFTDNTKAEFALADTPSVTVADDRLTVTTATTTASYELQLVSTFTYATTTAIAAVTQQGATLSGDRLVVPGTSADVSAYALDGRAVTLHAIAVGAQTVVDLGALPRGVYIIRANGKTLKIAKP